MSLHGAGEVLMNPRWADFVPDPPTYAHCVNFVTNGTLFTPHNVELLIRLKIHHLDISLDAGSEETYGKIRGGNWTKLWDGIDRLIASRLNIHPMLMANMTLMQSNVWEVAKLIPILMAKKFEHLHIFHLNRMPDAEAKAWRFPFNDGSGEFTYYDQQCLLPENKAEHDEAIAQAAAIARELSFPVRCSGLFFGKLGFSMNLHELVPS